MSARGTSVIDCSVEVQCISAVTLCIGQRSFNVDIPCIRFNGGSCRNKGDPTKKNIRCCAQQTSICIPINTDISASGSGYRGLQSDTIIIAGRAPSIYIDISSCGRERRIADQDPRSPTGPCRSSIQPRSLCSRVVAAQGDVTSC